MSALCESYSFACRRTLGIDSGPVTLSSGGVHGPALLMRAHFPATRVRAGLQES